MGGTQGETQLNETAEQGGEIQAKYGPVGCRVQGAVELEAASHAGQCESERE